MDEIKVLQAQREDICSCMLYPDSTFRRLQRCSEIPTNLDQVSLYCQDCGVGINEELNVLTATCSANPFLRTLTDLARTQVAAISSDCACFASAAEQLQPALEKCSNLPTPTDVASLRTFCQACSQDIHVAIGSKESNCTLAKNMLNLLDQTQSHVGECGCLAALDEEQAALSECMSIPNELSGLQEMCSRCQERVRRAETSIGSKCSSVAVVKEAAAQQSNAVGAVQDACRCLTRMDELLPPLRECASIPGPSDLAKILYFVYVET